VVSNRIFELSRIIMGGRRIFNDEELHNLTLHRIYWGYQLKECKMVGFEACMEESRKTEGKRTFGRHRYRWEGNIKMNVTGIVSECADWILLAQDRDQW
jgi:hypothetical protein